MFRRDLLRSGVGLGAASLVRPALAQGTKGRSLVFVPYSPLTALDPIWTLSNNTRTHGYLVFDSLYAMDASFEPRPQMAEGASQDDDGATWTITLRSGLKFHDGEPVRAVDCVSSLRRWMRKSPMGQKLDSVTAELTALDDRRLRFRLKQRFPQLLQALASIAPQALIMPERLARTDAYTQVSEIVGSGPYRFKMDEWDLGNRAVYERFSDYVPTPDAGDKLFSGPKQVHFDRVEWRMIPDPSTAVAALQSGEVDWYETPSSDFLPILKRSNRLTVETLDPFPTIPALRFNHMQPPFNSKKLRQALLYALDPSDIVQAVAGGDPNYWTTEAGVFPPGTPYSSIVGLDPLRGPRDLDAAKHLMKEAGYTNQPMRQIAPTDHPAATPISQVVADTVKRLGFNSDLAMSDWGTVIQRRNSREPVEQGGWSIFCTAFPWVEIYDPAVHVGLRGNGKDAYFGWPEMPAMEALRDRWFDAPDLTARKAIAEDMQRIAMDEVPFIPLGAYSQPTAYSSSLTDRVKTAPVFWNIRRS